MSSAHDCLIELATRHALDAFVLIDGEGSLVVGNERVEGPEGVSALEVEPAYGHTLAAIAPHAVQAGDATAASRWTGKGGCPWRANPLSSPANPISWSG